MVWVQDVTMCTLFIIGMSHLMDGKCLFMNQPYDCIVVLYNHVIVFTNIYCMVSRNCACNQSLLYSV